MNINSPPRPSTVLRIAFTTPAKRSVPMCGVAEYIISLGAPCSQNFSNTRRQRLSFIPVVSLPSEKVPAPPSPNCTFDSGFKTLDRQKLLTEAVRSSTVSPRSMIIGESPASVKVRAANIPAGPKPTITGLKVLLRFTGGKV